jgi:hypothetical protein
MSRTLASSAAAVAASACADPAAAEIWVAVHPIRRATSRNLVGTPRVMWGDRRFYMTRVSILAVALCSLATFSACKKKDEGSSSSGKTTEAAKPAGPTKLPKLGLQIDVPGKVEVGDAIMGEGQMLQGPGIGAMQIEIAKTPQTLDEAKSDADLYSPKNLKDETLADGWALTFENKGGAGTNYWVSVRRDIGGKTYNCTTTGVDPGQAAAVLAACKTLRP